MTGLWQVSGRSNLAWDETVRLDLYYVENWSLTAGSRDPVAHRKSGAQVRRRLLRLSLNYQPHGGTHKPMRIDHRITGQDGSYLAELLLRRATRCTA